MLKLILINKFYKFFPLIFICYSPSRFLIVAITFISVVSKENILRQRI